MCDGVSPLPCDSCGRQMNGRVYSYRNAPKNGFCKTCYDQLPKVACVQCERKWRTVEQDDFVCHACTTKSRACVHCGGTAYRGARIIDGKPVCAKCAHRVLVTRPCEVCNKEFKGSADWPESRPVCPACRDRMKKARPCAHCGTYSLFIKSDSTAGINEPICISCRKNARITCPGCRKHRRPAALDAQGRQICKECHKRGNKEFDCPQCGKKGIKYSKLKCWDCYWRNHAIKRVASCQILLVNKWSKDCFADFIQSLIDLRSPNYASNRVEYYFPFFAKLDSMFREHTSITAQILLNEFGPDGLRRYTVPYDFLAKTGVIIPLERDEIDAAAETRQHASLVAKADGKWFEKDIQEFHEHLQVIAKRYADRGWKGKNARFKPRTITSALRVAVLFYGHVDGCGIVTVSQIHQNIVDEFIFHNPGYKQALRTLIRYLNRHGKLFRQLKIETHPVNLREELFIPPTKYGNLVRQWLPANGAESKKALIGILMLMYAQPASKIVRLRLTDVLRDERGIYKVALGTAEIEFDPRISALFGRYMEQRSSLSMMEDDLHNEWLFPGRKYGCHISSASITCMLKEFGVSADQMFTTAIFNAYQTGMRHPKVLVRAFGITNATAIKYLKLIDPRMYDEVESISYSQHAV